MTELQAVRIDKWLWAARFFKTRTLAQEAVELGRVRLDGNRLKPSREVKPGDKLEITRGEEKFTVYVEKLSTVRGPASIAQTLYRETDESRILREENAAIRKLAAEPALSIKKGRPPSAMRVGYAISLAKISTKKSLADCSARSLVALIELYLAFDQTLKRKFMTSPSATT